MPPTTKVELHAAIRRDAREGLSGRVAGLPAFLDTLAFTVPSPAEQDEAD